MQNATSLLAATQISTVLDPKCVNSKITPNYFIKHSYLVHSLFRTPYLVKLFKVTQTYLYLLINFVLTNAVMYPWPQHKPI